MPCGLKVIEKHFTLRRADGGVDSAFSLEPDELRSLVVESERAFLALGHVQYGVQKAEEKSLIFKRSIYIIKNLKAGDKITEDCIRIIRPGDGIAPKFLDMIIGKTVKQDINAGTPLTWAVI
jgi:sialic acid synthase SpsE